MKASEYKVWTKEEIALLREEYPKGKAKRLCPIFKVNYSVLKQSAKKFGVKGKMAQFEKEYKLKHLLEDTIENYYWYGFIMADGYISETGCLSITLARKDKSHLEKFAKLVNVEVHDKRVKACGGSDISIVSCTDIHYGLQLKAKMNIVGPKTYNPPVLNFFKTEDHFWAFFAGFLDGDGCIRYKNNKISAIQINCHGSWLKNFQYFAEMLNYIGIRTMVRIDSRGYSLLTMSSGRDILILRDKFMELGLPILERKWFRKFES